MIKDPAQRRYYEKRKRDSKWVAKQRARCRDYYLRNKSKSAKRCRSWREKNADRIAAHKKKNANRNRELQHKWRQNNLPGLAKKQRQYRANNPDKVRACEARRVVTEGRRLQRNEISRRWKKANPDRRQASYQKRRATLAGGHGVTAEELGSIRKAQAGKCFYCKGALDNQGRGHIEHKTPLSRGGLHVASNVVISCAPCNLKKGTKTAEEFAP